MSEKLRLVVPCSIQVGGHTYSIVFNTDLKDDNDYGRVNHRLQRIELNPARPMSQKIEALIHEILHIINNVYLNQELTEVDMNGISEGLLQVVQQSGVEFDFSELSEWTEG